jgi:hypothetical protein
MRIVGLGVDILHTLVAIKGTGSQPANVNALNYHGSSALICELASQISDGTIPLPAPTDFFPINSQRVQTFAECRQHPDELGNAGKDEACRIHRVIGQTPLACDLSLSIGKLVDTLLVIEVPSNGIPMIDKNIIASKEGRGWAIVKAGVPGYIGSNLYFSLYNLYGSSQIIVMSLNTARRIDNSPLIKSLSWESAAEALYTALTHSLEGVGEKRPYAVIVSILHDGAVCFRATDPQRFTLIYDPQSIEGAWAKTKPGHMAGTTQCIAAAVAAGAADDFARINIEKYIVAGIHGARGLHQIGFQPGEPEPFPKKLVTDNIRNSLQADAKHQVFEFITVPEKVDDDVDWSIVKQRFWEPASGLGSGIVFERSWTEETTRDAVFSLVQVGIEQMQRLPVVKFGDLIAVLRDDIEGLRAISGLMQEYVGRDKNKRPLSIAVFGSPGSGKSFAVKEVSKEVSKETGDSGRKFETLEFNLSQFSSPDQLYEALHQVRDSSLSGKMPVVFFDEFDGEFKGPYGWLRYFLAPMQDGKFTQGQVSHFVGDAVFVFAGGTSHDVQTFRKEAAQAVTAKGPDFLSRLHGFLNIESLDHGEGLHSGVLIRRALLLRSLLLKLAPGITTGKKEIDIDLSVMRAFLCIKQFRYGARSIEAILLMSNLRGKRRFDPSCLPPLSQIDLHVNASEWRDWLEGTSESKLQRSFKPDDLLIGW